MRLGEAEERQQPRTGIRTTEVQDAFYSFLGFTRLDTSEALRRAIARGVRQGTFGHVSGSVPTLGYDGKYEVARERVVFGRAVAEDEVDLESGFLIMPQAIPTGPDSGGSGASGELGEKREEDYKSGRDETPEGDGGTQPQDRSGGASKEVAFKITGSRDQLYKAWPAIANLAEKAGKVSIDVRAASEEGFDHSWLRNAVYEPLEEADLLTEEA